MDLGKLRATKWPKRFKVTLEVSCLEYVGIERFRNSKRKVNKK